jgi:pimeloyl-ACP methyl ester carboxylesterase
LLILQHSNQILIIMKKALVILLVASLSSASAQTYQIGNISATYVDPDRNNRNIGTQIFYPAISQGSNVPLADGMFPVVVFGHGFVMGYSAYQFLWEALVPEGYIVALPTTEGGFSPNHLNLGLDIAFLIRKLKSEALDENSVFFGKVAANAAMMGHSMGGGASFLGSANNTDVTTLVTFAAAETNPSAIAAAADIQASALVFAGENDCVTPPSQHQLPMFNALQNSRKVFISINGGGHCLFNDYNFACAFGESTCSPNPTITREQQQQTVLAFLFPFFDFQLKANYSSWQQFYNLLYSNQDITFQDGWTTLPLQSEKLLNAGWNSFSFPLNPIENSFKTQFHEISEHIISFTNFDDISFSGENIPDNFFISPNEGYALKLTQAAAMQYAGYEHTDKSFDLNEGWNIMPVLSEQPVNPSQLFAPVTGHLVIIKEIAGYKVFWPEYNIQTLELLEPGNAYRVKVSRQVMINFDHKKTSTELNFKTKRY